MDNTTETKEYCGEFVTPNDAQHALGSIDDVYDAELEWANEYPEDALKITNVQFEDEYGNDADSVPIELLTDSIYKNLRIVNKFFTQKLVETQLIQQLDKMKQELNDAKQELTDMTKSKNKYKEKYKRYKIVYDLNKKT